MSTAVILLLIVIAILAGTTVTLLTSAKKGMPSPDVLKRASRRARELEEREKADPDP